MAESVPDAPPPPPLGLSPEEVAEIRKAARRTALECPQCFSHRGELLHTRVGNTVMCLDCDHIYRVHFRHIDIPKDTQEEETEPESSKAKELRTKNRKAKSDYREEIEAAPPLDKKELGTTTVLVDEAIASGPAGIRQAQRTALKYARQFQQEQEDRWKVVTPWLAAKQVNSSDKRARACATYALAWRPKFLAALSLTRAPSLAARFARITRDMAYDHRKLDPDFNQQWEDAQAEAVELLHARTFQRALEGDCEPIWYMGIRVGYVRKFSDKLQIEMLRAYRPDTFKTPGGNNVNIGTRGDVFVLTEEHRHKLMDYNREWLSDPSTLMIEDTNGHSVRLEPEALTHD